MMWDKIHDSHYVLITTIISTLILMFFTIKTHKENVTIGNLFLCFVLGALCPYLIPALSIMGSIYGLGWCLLYVGSLKITRLDGGVIQKIKNILFKKRYARIRKLRQEFLNRLKASPIDGDDVLDYSLPDKMLGYIKSFKAPETIYEEDLYFYFWQLGYNPKSIQYALNKCTMYCSHATHCFMYINYDKAGIAIANLSYWINKQNKEFITRNSIKLTEA